MSGIRITSKLCVVLLFLSVSSLSLAAPYTATFADTVGGGSDTPPFNPGEAFTISIVLDNGGSTAISQTWTSGDIVSITFTMNDAPNTISTTFSPVVLSSASGSFVTDGTGTLTAVPSSWNDFDSCNCNPGFSTVASTNDPATPTTFFINGANGVYHNSDEVGVSSNSAFMTNVGDNVIAANWSLTASVPATPVPTLSQWAMILLSLILLAFGLVKTRRIN